MIRNIFTNFSARLAVALMNFFMLLLVTHFLGRDVRGITSIIALNVSILHLISDLAGGAALVYLTPRVSLRALLLTGTAWSIFTAFGIGTILLYYGVFPSLYGKELLLLGLLISLHSLNQNLLLGQQRIKAFNILFFIQGLLQLVTMAACIFLFHQQDAYPYIYSSMAGYGLCYLAGLFIVHKNAPVPQIREKRPVLLVLFSNGFFTQSASLFLILSRLKIVNGIKAGLSDGNGFVGSYTTALALGEAILLFSTSISAVVMAKVANEDDHTDARASIIRLSKLSIALTTAGVAAFLLLPAAFYSTLIGKEFSDIKEIFFTIAPGIVLLSFGTVYSHYFSGAGKHYINFIAGAFSLFVTMLCTDFLVKKLGIEGAGYTYSITSFALTLVIFAAFLLVSTRKGEWKLLLPARSDISALRGLINRKIK